MWYRRASRQYHVVSLLELGGGFGVRQMVLFTLAVQLESRVIRVVFRLERLPWLPMKSRITSNKPSLASPSVLK
ncbi:hypothetical protein WG66_002061 [Moniliophthora roreri]|nr:hypothetical protein WG66_002061 [Moniliophthora roreri]